MFFFFVVFDDDDDDDDGAFPFSLTTTTTTTTTKGRHQSANEQKNRAYNGRKVMIMPMLIAACVLACAHLQSTIIVKVKN